MTTFGSVGSDGAKWFGGVLAPNGQIYGISKLSALVLKIDPETDTATTFGSVGSDVSSKWFGGVLAPNGQIYGIPYYSALVLKIDPETDTATTFGSLGSGSGKWVCGVLAPNGQIYGIPHDSALVLKIGPPPSSPPTCAPCPIGYHLARNATTFLGGGCVESCPTGMYNVPGTATCVTPVVVMSQPAATTTAVPGSVVSFSVAATGNGTRQYLWQQDGVPVVVPPQPHSATLVFGPVLAADNGTAFTCDVSNGATTVTTSSAALVVPLHAPTFFDTQRAPIVPVLLEQTGSTVILTWANPQRNGGGPVEAVLMFPPSRIPPPMLDTTSALRRRPCVL